MNLQKQSGTTPVGEGYNEHDAERFVAEQHSSTRSPFTRDRARVIHSGGWRRLAAKTQVLSPTAGIDFARNRLTHSLEVAQIGRELATTLGVEPDIVDTACLTHDLGHPPFGHNGERALDTWARDFGGFEGNAQTLRLITRLEAKQFAPNGASVGLNLTRATLDASCKYPWSLQDARTRATETGRPLSEHSPKFGYFDSDAAVFEWLRDGAVPNRPCVEAQIMDLADDIAYSVHDFEDAIVSGYIDPELLTSRSGHDHLIAVVLDWAGDSFSTDALGAAYERIAAIPTWLTSWSGSRGDQAQLKNFTSDMISRFAKAAVRATREVTEDRPIRRYDAEIIVPQQVSEEIAVLKGIVAAYVMASGRRQPTYQRQRDLLTELLEVMWETGDEHLEPAFADDYRTATGDAEAKRVIVDQVASLTDQSAIAWHARLCAVPLV